MTTRKKSREAVVACVGTGVWVAEMKDAMEGFLCEWRRLPSARRSVRHWKVAWTRCSRSRANGMSGYTSAAESFFHVLSHLPPYRHRSTDTLPVFKLVSFPSLEAPPALCTIEPGLRPPQLVVLPLRSTTIRDGFLERRTRIHIPVLVYTASVSVILPTAHPPRPHASASTCVLEAKTTWTRWGSGIDVELSFPSMACRMGRGRDGDEHNGTTLTTTTIIVDPHYVLRTRYQIGCVDFISVQVLSRVQIHNTVYTFVPYIDIL
ncbi:hypothetical protein C8R45DRAFT_1224058 [Mycena sanguinolenta]|nr:hypothetical protein C8R45DRAFT_1224058 [Mycena sanguinolenta]